jgi:hypothetical protein
VLLGLRAQPREDTGLSPAEAVFGAQIVLPNEFLQNDEFSVDTIVKKFAKTLHVSAPSLPRHNYCTELPSELPAELLSAPLVWVRRGGLVPPTFQPLYDGPYSVVRRGPRSFTIRVGPQDEVVAVSHLKACTAADATPGSPCRRGRPPSSRSGGLAATKGVSFSDPLVSSPSSSPALSQDDPGTVFLPSEEVFARPGPAAPPQPPQMRYPSRQRAPPQRLDLSSLLLPAEARARGEPCVELATSLLTVKPVGVYSTTLVQYLYISRYVTVNKPVLSYLLLCLLPQAGHLCSTLKNQCVWWVSPPPNKCEVNTCADVDHTCSGQKSRELPRSRNLRNQFEEGVRRGGGAVQAKQDLAQPDTGNCGSRDPSAAIEETGAMNAH